MNAPFDRHSSESRNPAPDNISHKETANKINTRQIVIGMAALIFGAIVYLIDRPPGDTYFVGTFPFTISLHERMPNLFGRLGDFLPDFIHPFAFSCMTAGIAASTWRGYLLVCLLWFGIDSLFEVGQKFGDSIARHVPQWFSGIPYLENTASYFRKGVFDSMDLAAIAAGCAAAYVVLCMTGERMKP